jgi:periplasmic protein TonB
MSIFNNWLSVTAPVRNDMVFAGKHKEYGAYQLRTKYNKTVMMALLGSTLLFIGIGAAPIIANLISGMESADKVVPVDVTPTLETPPPIDDTEPPPPPPPPPPPAIETVKFIPPVIKDDAVEDEPPPPQEKLEETQAGTTTQEGTGDNDIIVPEETGNGPVVEEKPQEIFTYVEEMPEFPGGDAALLKYISSNITYPQMAKEANIQGLSMIQFVVETDGSVSNAKVLKGVPGGDDCDKEALRVIKSFPRWKPGKSNGKPARVYYTVPVKFVLR